MYFLFDMVTFSHSLAMHLVIKMIVNVFVVSKVSQVVTKIFQTIVIFWQVCGILYMDSRMWSPHGMKQVAYCIYHALWMAPYLHGWPGKIVHVSVTINTICVCKMYCDDFTGFHLSAEVLDCSLVAHKIKQFPHWIIDVSIDTIW